MGKSQARKLREATKRFGREDWNRLARTREQLFALVYTRKKEAGLISPVATVIRTVSTGPTLIKRYSTSLTYYQNEDKFGRSFK